MTEQSASPTPGPLSASELIVVVDPALGLRATGVAPASTKGYDLTGLNQVLEAAGATLLPLFGSSEERVEASLNALPPSAAKEVPDLTQFYRVTAPANELETLAEVLRRQEGVVAAYVKPPAEPPVHLRDLAPTEAMAPPVTRDFSGNQEYLGEAPGGIDAYYAWGFPGGRGADVRVVDVEGAWRFSHEDLRQNQGGVVGGSPSSSLAWRNHGTAVVGVVGGDDGPFGVVGICPDASCSAVSIFDDAGQSQTAAAIRTAADRLRAGDVLLIELHLPGPRFNFTPRGDRLGYIAVEWWPDDFAAIRYAVARGIVVVEAAGNGAENLDDPLYDQRPSDFPPHWSNPFRRGNRDSGAILVGAGAPPPGVHGRDHGPDRSRLAFSNYGRAVDVQGWGEEVTTTGYGDLQGGWEDEWYTDQFSGTSSASPVVVGALGCCQGILRARGGAPLSPGQARTLLRSTGTPQKAAPGRPTTQRIGSRPNLREMIARLGVV